MFRPVGDTVSRQQKTWPLDIAVEKKKCGDVVDPGKGVCADPVNRDAILGKGGPAPEAGTRSVSLARTEEGIRRDTW